MLIQLLRDAVAQRPDQDFIVTSSAVISYADCLARSEAIARGLRARSIKRFAAVLDPVDLIPVLCASTAIGADACSYPPGSTDEEIEKLAGAFDHDVVLRTDDLDALEVVDGDLPEVPAFAPVLILTSGTTGEPKGARHDWARLVGGVPRTGGDAPQRWLLAYNLNQFAGVQMLLHVLVNAATLVIPDSNQPRFALAAMRDLGVTHASGTPTFWRFVTAQLDPAEAGALGLRQITMGGEAIPAPLLAELRRLFPDTRVSQVYASTESGSGVSVRDAENGLPLSVLDRGDDANAQMKIVDGELYIRSRVGMLGYYGQPDLPDDNWRATGDLVEIRGDRVYFTGRDSEIINVGGVKVHPLPVEELAGAVQGVQVARAYGRKNAMTGQIVALDILPLPGADTERIEEAVREALASLPPAAQPRRIKFVDDLEVRGQKIVRSE